MSQALGRHILVEFFNCNSDILNDVNRIEEYMVNAAKTAEATIINSTFHHFSPYGVSGVVVIQESHLAIHTWPEFRYAAVDIFTCGDVIDPWIGYDELKRNFEAEQGSAMEINRGQIDLLKRISFDVGKDREAKQQEIVPKFKREVWFTDKDQNVALSIRHKGKLLFNEQSKFQKVQVYDTFAYGKMLTIDNMVMCTEKDEYGYHEMLIHIPMNTHPNPRKVLVIGGGDGGSIREILRHPEVESVKMVEIDDVVVKASKQHLPTLSSGFDHERLELIIGDGIQYLADCAAESYDVIIIDGSDPEGPSEGLFTASFFKDVHRCLKSDGLLCTHSESPHFNRNVFVELTHCVKGIFGTDKVNTFLVYIPTYPTGMWSFLCASKGDLHPLRDLDDGAADLFAEEHGLQYYHAGIHRSAFVLPRFVRDLLE